MFLINIDSKVFGWLANDCVQRYKSLNAHTQTTQKHPKNHTKTPQKPHKNTQRLH